MNRVLSTRELAALCGVNESTIKRWADSGRLECVKTPGGHRKFRAEDVYGFLNRHGFDTSFFGAALAGLAPPTGAALAEGISPGEAQGGAGVDTPLTPIARLTPAVRHGIRTHEPAPLVEAYISAARNGGYRMVRQILAQLLAARWSVIDICEDILAPALESVGTQWAVGEMSIMHEHLITASTLESLSLLGEEMPRREPNGRRALCCGGQSDQHSLGIRMTALALESVGWSVALSISAIPLTEVSRYLEQSRPDLVCISLVYEPIESGFRQGYGDLCQTARRTGTRIAIGGREGGNGIDLAADFRGQSLRQLIGWAERLELPTWSGGGRSSA